MQAWDDPVATSAKLMTDERRESADGDSRSTVPVALVSPTATSWKPRGPVRDWQSIVIHHTATESGSVESIHRVHQQRTDAAGNPWRGIGYHFVIGNGQGMEDGAVEPTFRWRGQLEGAHAGVSRYNEQGVGVCLVGDFDQHPPTKAQLASLKLLIAWLTQEYGISFSQVKGHGQLKATACPGKFFPMEEVTDHYLKNTSHRINTLASHSTL
ncbi:MAG: N-acetylmuramoyl-L-alanine amidase [Planctomycetaceae bacterium]|nr:N-acetylmuramoyl-L-alanine amidase [Planctomycetaceae bacterium]